MTLTLVYNGDPILGLGLLIYLDKIDIYPSLGFTWSMPNASTRCGLYVALT
jgi:hypothetical protein